MLYSDTPAYLGPNVSFNDILSRIKYKNNVRFYWLGNAGPSKCLIISFEVEDSYNPGTIILVEHSFPCPWYGVGNDSLKMFWSEKEQIEWIFEKLLQAEKHEAREFFKVDGIVFNPPGHGFDDPYS